MANKKKAAEALKQVAEAQGYVKKGLVTRILEALGVVSVSGQGDAIRDAGLQADRPNRRQPAKGYWPPEE